MKRRRFLSSVTLVLTGTMFGSEILLSGCEREKRMNSLNEQDIDLLNEIGETIIPATSSSPGAKAAKVGEFMKVYVSDCYPEEKQQIFFDGIQSFKNGCKEKYGKSFLDLTVTQQKEVLRKLDKEVEQQTAAQAKRKAEIKDGDAIQAGKGGAEKKKEAPDSQEHYYSMIKHLTLFGYFTSEVGATEALRYKQTPGYYSGDVPWKGEKSWAV